MYKTNFNNEINNKITLKIKNVKDSNKNSKTKNEYKFDAVNIQLIGPTSMSENIITYKEAEELYLGLKNFLSKNEMKTFKEV